MTIQRSSDQDQVGQLISRHLAFKDSGILSCHKPHLQSLWIWPENQQLILSCCPNCPHMYFILYLDKRSQIRMSWAINWFRPFSSGRRKDSGSRQKTWKMAAAEAWMPFWSITAHRKKKNRFSLSRTSFPWGFFNQNITNTMIHCLTLNKAAVQRGWMDKG